MKPAFPQHKIYYFLNIFEIQVLFKQFSILQFIQRTFFARIVYITFLSEILCAAFKRKWPDILQRVANKYIR